MNSDLKSYLLGVCLGLAGGFFGGCFLAGSVTKEATNSYKEDNANIDICEAELPRNEYCVKIYIPERVVESILADEVEMIKEEARGLAL